MKGMNFWADLLIASKESQEERVAVVIERAHQYIFIYNRVFPAIILCMYFLKYMFEGMKKDDAEQAREDEEEETADAHFEPNETTYPMSKIYNIKSLRVGG